MIFGTFKAFAAGAALASIAVLSSQPASAADMALKAPAASMSGGCAELVLMCENGRQYALCPIAVSITGDIVTASLSTGAHSSHVRLVPMGVGYRYAGRGIWLDGFRDQALLNFGKHQQIACTVSPS
ncbi:MAG: hypothetical protein J0G37_15965 [Afipia sp.]|jgi:hypothetical protein|nr:hypothetical protein [Afipia sp.]